MLKRFYRTLIITGLVTIYSNTVKAQSDQNTFLGYQAGINNSSGYANTLVGNQSGYHNSTGINNVFIGNQAGFNNTAGVGNLFLGQQAGYSSTSANYNMFMGNSAGLANTTGSVNVFIGSQAGYSNTTGSGNVFIGQQAGYNNIGSDNVFIGNSSGSNTAMGVGNTAFGSGSLLRNTAGNYSTAIGLYAGVASLGNNNVFIGYGADVDPGTPNLTNVTTIGALARATQSNSVILGFGSNVGLGNSAPQNKLEITKGVANQSGLRLTNLTSSSPASVTNQFKFLTVNASGDVVLGSLNGSARVGAVSDLWEASGGNIRNANEAGVIIGQGIKKTPSGYKLFVEEGILTEKVKVAVKSTADWSDKVFEKGYFLKSLPQVASYLKTNKHLPGIPSAWEMVKQGNDLHRTDALLLEKIEELTLYLIEQHKTLVSIRQENRKMRKEISVLKSKRH